MIKLLYLSVNSTLKIKDGDGLLTNFKDILYQNHLQKEYLEIIIKKRDPNFSNQAFMTPINTYFTKNLEKLTSLDLVYHGLGPLYTMAQLLLYPEKKSEEIELPQLSKWSPNEQVTKAYEMVLAEIEYALDNTSIDKIVGELAIYNGDEESFKRELGTQAMHATNHLAQAIRFQGLICEELAS